jgi:hypothetical protein
MSLFVETGKGGYFNFQANTTLGQLWALECYMNQLGEMYFSNTDGILGQTTYSLNQWFDIRFDINLNTNQWDVFINNTLVNSFANTVNQIASIDIYPVNGATFGGNNQAGFYVDDVSFSHTPYTLPNRNGAVTQVSGVSPGLVGQSKQLTATVRNLGTTPITTFDLAVNYNSGQFTQSFTQTIASLASATVTLTTPVTLAAGSMPLSVTISNVNALGADGDANDDSKSITVDPVVPAAGKIVVGEEATGTWCQWCPRGAVYMDYMENNYEGHWAGIAVHNGDPMTVAIYDAGMGALISGYPSQLVDRVSPEIDPSGVEDAFMSRIVVPGAATITNGAQFNQSTGALNVSLTYNFTSSVSGQYRVACVLTEDSVTGSNSQYSQSNAYAGGNNGAMGGYESLPNPVPFTMMKYDHVARAISPSFAGGTGLPTTISSGYTQTFLYSFTVPSTWNPNRMHIIGMLIEPNGTINNGSTTTITEAVANGYVGVNDPQPTQNEVTLFPNPATENTSLSVTLDTPEDVMVTIYDITGKIISQRDYGTLTGNYLLPINTTGFQSGVYIVELRTGDAVSTKRMIVQ